MSPTRRHLLRVGAEIRICNAPIQGGSVEVTKMLDPQTHMGVAMYLPRVCVHRLNGRTVVTGPHCLVSVSVCSLQMRTMEGTGLCVYYVSTIHCRYSGIYSLDTLICCMSTPLLEA